jgi:hypothetical protein
MEFAEHKELLEAAHIVANRDSRRGAPRVEGLGALSD